MNAKELILHFYNAYHNADEFIRSSLSGAINRLQKAFPKRGHFLMEFIQNADDCQSEYLKVVINEKAINVYNSGRVFSEEDVRSICQVGQSSKTPADYIGYLGVGFKSVFLVSNEPHIFSGDFRFKFSKSAHGDEKKLPWQVMPIWVDFCPEGTETAWWKTSFHLPLTSEDPRYVTQIRKEIETETINSRLLLFLKHLRQIEIVDSCNNSKRVISKSSILEETESYRIYELKEEKNSEPSLTKWLLFRTSCDVPPEVQKDGMTIEWERENVKKREVLAAFRLTSDNILTQEEHGGAHIGVFSFLPLKEEIEGLRFLIQGDFLTAPGRESLSRKALWNDWLCSEIVKLITERCVPIFAHHDKWKMNFARILFTKNTQSHFFDLNLKQKLNQYLAEHPVVVSEDGSLIKAGDAIRLSQKIRGLFDEDSLTTLFPNKKVLHQDCDTGEIEITEGPRDVMDILSDSKFSGILQMKAEKKDASWFINLYREMKQQSDLKERIGNVDFILTEDYQLCSVNRALLPTRDLPKGLQHNFRLVHQSIVGDTESVVFLRALGVQEVTDKLIRELAQEKQVPQWAEQWTSFSEDERREKLGCLFELWQKHKIESKAMSFVTLQTKRREWLPPDKIQFGDEFSPEPNPERVLGMIEKHLIKCSQKLQEKIKGKLNEDLRLNFLLPETVPAVGDRDWRKFLQELGVHRFSPQERSSLANKLSVVYVLIHEDLVGREPEELTESEKRGYDIRSHEQGKDWKIEVKGSDKKTFNLFLSAHEYETLLATSKRENEEYVIYIVPDVYNPARIYKLTGKTITESSEVGINITATQWKYHASSEFIW